MCERATCMVWCEVCTAENWDDVSAWKWEGLAVTRGGTLKRPECCRSCDAELQAGERVEAITLYHGRPESTAWMEEVVELDGDEYAE